MPFQSTVANQQGFGVPGEMFTNSPHIAQTFTLVSASAAYNIIGATCCTVTSQGFCEAGSGGGDFAGFLVNPKVYPLLGTTGNTLAPSLVLPNEGIAELLTMGTIIVTLPANANIGDLVVYDDTTGAIATIAPAAALPVGKKFANAIVKYITANAGTAQLAVVQVNPTYVIPQLA